MTFARKVFAAVIITSTVVGVAIILTTYKYVREQTEDSFVSRYTTFSQTLGNTLTQLDLSTEALMLNAAHVLSGLDAEKGLLSTEYLRSIRSNLNVTHIFVVDRNGKFIRTTNEKDDIAKIPNAYSFCPAYREMIVGNTTSAATPIIFPNPEPQPYKFLFVPSRTRERLLEVGVRIDFVADTLKKALGADSNVLAIGVYDPYGSSFGTFTSKNYEFSDKKIKMPSDLPAVIDEGRELKFYTKVTSSHPQCCQCDISGVSKNGEYYYVLETVVSKSEITAALAKTKIVFFGIAIAMLLVSYFFGRLLVKKVVRNIKIAAQKIDELREGDNTTGRLNIEGNDEIARLANKVDGLLDKIDEIQAQAVENEKIEAKVLLAQEIAHNIRSPIIAIKTMLPMMTRLPDNMKRIMTKSIEQIWGLSEKLKKQADSMSFETSEPVAQHLPIFLKDYIAMKQYEFSGRQDVTISFEDTTACNDAYVKCVAIDLQAILSNLINNAVDSYGSHGGNVSVSLSCDVKSCTIEIRDKGAGIPEEYLAKLGYEPITFKGGSGRGVGLPHAFKIIRSWGADIQIASVVGVGTTFRVILPRMESATKPLSDEQVASIM